MKKQPYSLKDFLEIRTSVATSFSPDGKKLAVVSNKTGTLQLYSMDRDGSNLEQLTFFEDNIDFATFSPAENEVIFGMSKGGSENSQLYLYDLGKKEYKSS